MTETVVLIGIPGAPGLASGPIIKVQKQALKIPHYTIEDSAAEKQRLKIARTTAIEDLKGLRDSVRAQAKAKEAEIFDAHMMFLEDDSLVSLAESEIKSGKNAEAAWMNAIESIAQQLEDIPDPTLSARAVDLRDVGQRVLGHLLGLQARGIKPEKPAIIVSRDLTPSDTVSLDHSVTLGFVTAEGGPTSHTAILAKAFGIPAVVGVGDELLTIPDDTFLLVDGNTGEVIVNPDEQTRANFAKKQAASSELFQIALSAAFEPAITTDGKPVEVVANIGNETDAHMANQNGAEGVGLFRTEFLYLDRKAMPTEEESIQAYREIFAHFEGQPIVVRTLDIGGDKEIPYLDFPKELNPFLGWRGVRMLHGREDLMRTQVRALLQAGVGVDLRIMVPMIALQEEVDEMKALLEREKEDLPREHKSVAENVQFGIMVEVPSAAILSDRLARNIDFFSIGTNDLTQYAIAVDRTNAKVANLASSFNPAVLFLIQRTIDSAHAAGKWCGLCGEFAGEPYAIPLLLGMGLDEFSMSPARIPTIKQLIRQLDSNECRQLADQALSVSTAEEVKALVKAFIAEKQIAID
jgi:phosphotransferase system enzyme I (PtsI)